MEQFKSDTKEFLLILVYTVAIFLFGFSFAYYVQLFKPKAPEPESKPTQYILPESPAMVYCSNKRYSF